MTVVPGYLEQVQRGIDFIEERLGAEIDLAEVARHAYLSQWHFQRIFKALTGETLKTYIRSRRMAAALGALLTTDRRIIDIAMDAGYETQESFTRAFKHLFGITPNEYRKLGDRSMFLTKVHIDEDYLRHIQQNVSRRPEVAHHPAMRLVGARTCFYGADSEKNNMADKIPALWESFLPRLEEIAGRVPGTCYGVIRQTSESSDLLEYHAAMEVTGTGDVPQGMVEVEVPAARYASFAHRGPVAELDHTVNYVYSTWLLGSGERHTYGPDLEIYGPGYHPTSPDSVIHYAIPVGGPMSEGSEGTGPEGTEHGRQTP